MNTNVVTSLLREKYDCYMELKICLDFCDSYYEMKKMYNIDIAKHNEKMLTGDFMNAGFDLICPTQFACVSEKVNNIDFGVKCSAKMIYNYGVGKNDLERTRPTGFYMYPKSSLPNTPLRLANSIEIVDAGYSGNLIGMFDYKERSVLSGGEEDKGWYLVEKGDRLVQICAPGLVPIFVKLMGNG